MVFLDLDNKYCKIQDATTLADAQVAVERMLYKAQSNNITIKPTEPESTDICFTYELMSYSAQGKGGNKWPTGQKKK